MTLRGTPAIRISTQHVKKCLKRSALQKALHWGSGVIKRSAIAAGQSDSQSQAMPQETFPSKFQQLTANGVS